MFAAAKTSHESELFKLALELIASKELLPSSLIDHVNSILSQAKKIADTPENLSNDSLPEAIDLAVGIISKPSLSKGIREIDSVNNISPSIASTILKEMEISPVC